ncbi:relaxase/mobilization nuclease domain-containing protein [Pedobacter sp. ISL-68]|uniref:relaxase/mobilization nuclease domain-containing protein n=1 Tax=unclassified Pedobacter TaxID=2628915 RepID=UPI001BEBC47B|nr:MULTISPECIES: relaxase/mobilization nuclease domain-containing protein [unclassified Pedobacter]MBT2563746.1 relaxase/mobilization nuclease domain-containing protein [Pedobacter sp. ISL-64]MBT2589638.1 relaxase/mobilization nuclease domain-containing protein [Pedobacter sp. ISL-68]
MVAKIVSGKNIRGILIYNENKVEKGEALLFMASGFAGNIDKMNLAQKAERFNKRTMLNPSVKTNALHLTLNFHPSDKLDGEKLQRIVSEYMEQIGFDHQPFLVYLHEDAHHPHVHIATTNIRVDGSRIDIHGIGYKHSEEARKSIEQKYDLTVAGGRSLDSSPKIKPAVYGEVPTKRTIGNIVTAVMKQYRYSSFPEFNAALKAFNITADRGAEDSVMYEKRGLLYSILNENGNKVGIPIKASAIYAKPTLDNLEKRFDKNRTSRKVFRDELEDKIDGVFKAYQSITKTGFVLALKEIGVTVDFRRNQQGRIYGVTFIDHGTKSVFNGSNLGKAYSANSLTRSFGERDIPLRQLDKRSQENTDEYFRFTGITDKGFLERPEKIGYLDMVLSRSDEGFMQPTVKKKKRRKKLQQHL